MANMWREEPGTPTQTTGAAADRVGPHTRSLILAA